MLPLRNEKDRVRLLSAVARKGASYHLRRIVTITFSLGLLLVVPLTRTVRLDLWAGEHYLLQERVDFFTALKGFIVSMAVMYGATFLSNLVVGRFFCGWGCPVGYVSRLGEEVDLHAKKPLSKWLHRINGGAFAATFVAAVMLWWVDPMVLVDGSMKAKLVTLGIFAFLWIGGFAHAFIWRFGFCVNVCPIGLYYRYVTSRAPVSIVFNEDPSPCIECGGCETVCPVAIDPKALGTTLVGEGDEEGEERYGDAECIRCGDCVEACRMVFKKRKGETPPLRFGWSFRSKKDEEESEAEPVKSGASSGPPL